MSTQERWPTPDWLADLPDDERHLAFIRYMLCVAVAFSGDKATPATLSRSLGLSDGAVNIMKHRGQVSPEIAVALERLLGRVNFPREMFRPDLFIIPAE